MQLVKDLVNSFSDLLLTVLITLVIIKGLRMAWHHTVRNELEAIVLVSNTIGGCLLIAAGLVCATMMRAF